MRRRLLAIAPLVVLSVTLAIAGAIPRQVLVTSRHIPDGDFLHNDMFEVRTLPAYRTSWFALTRSSQAVGRLANRPIPAGQVVVKEDLFDSRPRSEDSLIRYFAPFLSSTPSPSIVTRNDTQVHGWVDVSVEMEAADAPLLVAGMFVDVFDGESLVVGNVRVVSVEKRPDGKVVATLSVRPMSADRLSSHAAALRFELAGAAPPRAPHDPPKSF